MKYLKTALLVSSVAFFTACGSSGSSSVDYSGNYEVVMSSTTETDIYGSPCLGANGIFTVRDNLVSGTVQTGWGDIYTATGDVQSDGYISGNLNIGTTMVAIYSGDLNSISGEWQDILECRGTWIGVKQ